MKPVQDFKIDHSQPDVKYYTTNQYQEFIDDNECYRLGKDCDKVYAKSIKQLPVKSSTNISQIKYYIRSEGKKLFDPFPKYSISDNKNSFLDKVCRGNNGFMEVSKSVFDKYISFLKTENSQWYNQATRELA